MVYPVAVLLVAVGIVWFLLSYVVPEFAVIFEDFGAKLPHDDAVLIQCGDFAQIIWKVALCFNGTIITIKVLSKIHTVKRITDRVVLRIPLVGDLITRWRWRVFAHAGHALITSGVPILQSLRITKETIGNEVIETPSRRCTTASRRATIAAPLDESVFPPMVVNMIDVGEETGSLDAMLMKVADIYARGSRGRGGSSAGVDGARHDRGPRRHLRFHCYFNVFADFLISGRYERRVPVSPARRCNNQGV